MHAALMLPHQLVEAAGRDLLSFTRNSRIQSCGQRRLHFAPLVLSIWTSLRAPGLQPASKCLRPLLWALCSQLLLSCPQEEVEIGQHLRITGGAFAIRPSHRSTARPDRSGSFRRASLERLAASDIRPNSLCCCCRVGWVDPPALHHAMNPESAHLGVHPCLDGGGA